MKILLRDVQTGTYLAGDERWIGKADEAMEFDSSTAAAIFATRRAAQMEVEIVLSYGHPQLDMVVPLNRPKCSGSARKQM